VIYAISGHLRFAPFKQYFIWHKDRLFSIIAIWAVIIFGVLNGLLIAVIVSVFLKSVQALIVPVLKSCYRWLSICKSSGSTCNWQEYVVQSHTLLYMNIPLFPQSSYDSQSVDDAVHQLESNASAN